MKKNNKNKKNNKVKESKSFSKKKIIIVSVIALLLCIGGYFLYQYKKAKEPIKVSWGQKYYMFLKDVNENNMQEDAGLPKKLDKSKLSFYEVESVKEPVMVITYEKNKNNYSNVYYIDNDKVNTLIYEQPTTIEFLYNIENKKYDYYSHIKENNNNKYKSIAEQIQERIKELEKSKQNTSNEEQKVEEITEYNFSDETVDKVTDVNGKEIVLNKFDETFVKPDIKEETVDYNIDLEEKDLKKIIEKQVDNYKTVEETVTKETQKQVDKEVLKVEKTKKEMETAKEEVEKKEAEEKAKKEAEEREKAEKEGFQVGSYRVKYGRYEWDLGELGDYGKKEVYILRSDKTCTHITYEGKTFSCTFRVGRATDGQSVESAVERDAIKIRDNGGYESSYFPKNNGFRDTDLQNFLYKGAE